MAVGQWIKVAYLEDVPPGEGFRVEVGDVPVALWNVEGKIYATDDTCSHEESSLVEGDLWGEVIECALHGAQFDVTNGEVLSLPAVVPINSYPVKVEDGAIYLEWSNS